MQSILEANRISSWSVALTQGVSAALRSFSKGGVVGELPFCDLLLVLDTQRVPNTTSGDNVFYGLDTHWSRMMIKSFQSRRLKFSYVLLNDKLKCDHNLCHGCLMVRDPFEEKRKKKEQKLRKKSSNSNNMTAYGTANLGSTNEESMNGVHTPTEQTSINIESTSINNVQLTERRNENEIGKMMDPIAFDPACIQPSMLYGLSQDYHREDGVYKVIHKSECIKDRTIDKRAIEFLHITLQEKLASKTYQAALNLCQAIIEKMCDTILYSDDTNANSWDKLIIKRVEQIIRTYPNIPRHEYDIDLNQVMDRILSRLPDMLMRLECKSFAVEMDGELVDYMICDLEDAFIVFFGIKRALSMSDTLYNHGSLIFMGYDASIGQDVIHDVAEVPFQDIGGFTGKYVNEKTSKAYMLENDTGPSHIIWVALLFDALISVAIMLLTLIGPMLSMYGARLWTSSYRESHMRKGTSMSWSVSQVSMMNTGQARDDWMACIKPLPRYNRLLLTMSFFLLSLMSSTATIILWPFFHPTLVFPFSTFSRAICITSCIVGVPWVIVAHTMFKAKTSDDNEAEKKKKSLLSNIFSIRTVHSIVNIGFVSLLIICAVIGLENSWLYLYGLEAVYALQWLYGELTDEWMYESTALFMLGALSALRLINIPTI
ncbi:hypothetical protein K492DRAFT_196424 [Lichtheimia hyalospora FSU 10163]|nr:hypothetical protein K492DRAFT_196424 [Lichtheimia hyalospora FSU 10163]